ncbi:Uncharacterised protein [Vibrio cholerae]|nr:Uncharacterised protein [Vibrio cholerae]
MRLPSLKHPNPREDGNHGINTAKQKERTKPQPQHSRNTLFDTFIDNVDHFGSFADFITDRTSDEHKPSQDNSYLKSID